MNIKNLKSFITFILSFVGLNSLFIKMDNKKALIMAVILYCISLLLERFKE